MSKPELPVGLTQDQVPALIASCLDSIAELNRQIEYTRNLIAEAQEFCSHPNSTEDGWGLVLCAVCGKEL